MAVDESSTLDLKQTFSRSCQNTRAARSMLIFSCEGLRISLQDPIYAEHVSTNSARVAMLPC